MSKDDMKINAEEAPDNVPNFYKLQTNISQRFLGVTIDTLKDIWLNKHPVTEELWDLYVSEVAYYKLSASLNNDVSVWTKKYWSNTKLAEQLGDQDYLDYSKELFFQVLQKSEDQKKKPIPKILPKPKITKIAKAMKKIPEPTLARAFPNLILFFDKIGVKYDENDIFKLGEIRSQLNKYIMEQKLQNKNRKTDIKVNKDLSVLLKKPVNSFITYAELKKLLKLSYSLEEI